MIATVAKLCTHGPKRAKDTVHVNLPLFTGQSTQSKGQTSIQRLHSSHDGYLKRCRVENLYLLL